MAPITIENEADLGLARARAGYYLGGAGHDGTITIRDKNGPIETWTHDGDGLVCEVHDPARREALADEQVYLAYLGGYKVGRTGAYPVQGPDRNLRETVAFAVGLDRGKNDNMSEDMARAKPEQDPASSLTGPESFEDVLASVKILLTR
jgi:hypothetical protein